jgi:predicted transcriptional regulator
LNLQNQTRLRAKAFVSFLPGVHLRELQRLLGVSFSTTRYHVRNLQRDGEIVCAKHGRYSCLFLAGVERSEMPIFADFQRPSTRAVLKVLTRGGASLLNLEASTGLSRSAVSEQLGELVLDGLVLKEDTERGIVFRVKEVERVSRLLSLFERHRLALVTDRFIDLWDF